MELLKVAKQKCKVIVIVLLLISVHIAYAASTKPASVMLQEGLYAEEVEGNLDEAIKIYQEVITASQQMEQSAAQATYRIGLCYLKKGDTEQAAKQFSQLITKYPEQKSLVQEAQKQLKKLQPPITYSFGPIIERIVNDDGEPDNCLIDLDSGVLFSPPAESKTEQEGLSWIADNHIDAVGDTRESGPGLYGFDMAVIPLANARWEGLSSQELTNELSIAKTGNPALLIAEGNLPKTFMFKTREDGMGVLQILEMQNNTKPRHFKIRYKMLRQEREIILPNADDFIQEGTPVILNLSTGKFLNGYFDKDYIKQLKEGDIAYSDDEGKDILSCFRGEKITRKLENGQYSNTPDQINTDTNMNLYIIKIPSEMSITTKEGETYELTVLSKFSKGLNIKYAKTLMQHPVAKIDNSDETGDPVAAAKMIAPLYGMFSSAYESLMRNNDPNTAQAVIEMAMPQLDIFENLMKGTDSYQSISMGIQVMREINESLKNREIEKAKGLLNVINTSGEEFEKMVKEEASKAEKSKNTNNSSSIKTQETLTPIVINTEPKNYSNNVSPDTKEISVTFNKEMMDKSWSWVKWNYTFPEITGQISYDKTKTTCTLPVKLEPGKAYLLRVNAGQYSSFMSSDGVKAQPFVFVFSTLDSSGKPTPIPEEMLNFAKQINSAAPEKTYTQEFSAEITPDGVLKFKGTIIQKNNSGSKMTTHSFVNSDNVNLTAMHDEKGQPLKFTANHNGNIFRYHVTLNEPVKAGEIFTYSTEGTMDGMILPVIGNQNTYIFRMSHSPATDKTTMRIETYLLPKGAELISMNPKDMTRTEKDGRIELRHEQLIPIGGNIVTQFQYKLEK